MTRSGTWRAAVLAATVSCRVLGQVDPRAPEAAGDPPLPPPIRPWRYDEDYSYLRDVRLRTGEAWERWKFVPLDERQHSYLSVGGELRARYERFDDDVWGAATVPDHDYWWLRALPYVDVHAGERVRAFAQLILAWELGDEAETSPTDENRADVLQAFADLQFPLGTAVATVRAGRQVLALGSERLVSTRYGPNVMRSFDLARVLLEGGGVHVEAFWGRPVAVEPGTFDDTASDTEAIWSIYATADLGFGDHSGLDLYYIGYENERAEFEQGAGDELRHTLGARCFGASGAWDWNFELFEQFGSFGTGDVSAWSIASDTGWTLRGLPATPRLGLKADAISGDHDPHDADLETFNPLFPRGKYFGEIGLIGPYNLLDLHPSLTLRLAPQCTAELGAVWYWRESTGDGVYDNGGNLLRGSDGSAERFVGTQLDASLAFELHRSCDVTLAWSTFLPGAFLQDTGAAERVHFFAAEVCFVF